MFKHIDIEVFGDVQGVFFRDSASKKAQELNIKGVIKNTERNSVFIQAEGENSAIEKFLEWCSQGPEGASVKHIKIMLGEVKNYTDFKII